MPDTSRRLELETKRLRDRLDRGDPLWPAQLAVGAAIALHLTLSQKVVIGPTWLVPVVEGMLLLLLVVIAPSRADRRSLPVRRFALFVIGLVSLTMVVSLVLLVHFLINGGKAGGHGLILSGIVLWATNVLIFAVWYWEMDRGGPVARLENPTAPVAKSAGRSETGGSTGCETSPAPGASATSGSREIVIERPCSSDSMRAQILALRVTRTAA